jgi:hypothetical protein
MVEDEDEEVPEGQITLTPDAGPEDEVHITLEGPGTDEIDEVEEVVEFDSDRGILTAEHVDEADLPEQVVVSQSLADLVAKLWRKKSGSATFELHTSDGEKIVPDRFLPKLSQGSHGVFAVVESDGTVTVTAVAWNSVSRVVVRRLNEVPE